MNIWKILEIEETKDQSLIKKAYAKKIKVCKPEANPEDFQQLRNAYEIALKYASGTEVNFEINKATPPSDNSNNGNYNKSPLDLAFSLLDELFKDETQAIELLKEFKQKGLLDNLEFSQRFQETLAINLLTVTPRKDGFVCFVLDFFNLYEQVKYDTNSFFNVAIKNLIIHSRAYYFLNHLHYLSQIKNKKTAKSENIVWENCSASKILLNPPNRLKFRMIKWLDTKKHRAILELLSYIENNHPELIGMGINIHTAAWWLRKPSENLGYLLLGCFLVFSVYSSLKVLFLLAPAPIIAPLPEPPVIHNFVSTETPFIQKMSTSVADAIKFDPNSKATHHTPKKRIAKKPVNPEKTINQDAQNQQKVEEDYAEANRRATAVTIAMISNSIVSQYRH